MSENLVPTHEAFNHLMGECCPQFGKVYETLEKASPTDIAAYRERDLFILRATAEHLPQIKLANADEAGCLCIVGTHMNTYEGAVACFALLAKHFPEHAAAPNECLRDFEKHRAPWQAKFGNNPISPADYAPDSKAATFRPLPQSTLR